MLLSLATEPFPMQWSAALCTPGTATVLPFPDLQLLCTRMKQLCSSADLISQPSVP